MIKVLNRKVDLKLIGAAGLILGSLCCTNMAAAQASNPLSRYKTAKTVPLSATATKQVSSNVKKVDGLEFPKVVIPSLQFAMTSGNVCEVGDERTFTQNFSHHGKYKQKKSWQESRSHSFYSPNFWVVLSGNVVLTSRGSPADFQTTTLQQNLHFMENEEFEDVQSSLHQYVLNLDIPDVAKANIDAKIEEFISNYQSYNQSLNSSHGGFRVRTTVRGTGRVNFNTGHSWVEGNMLIQSVCLPPELSSSDDLGNFLKIWVDNETEGLPGNVAMKPAVLVPHRPVASTPINR